MIEGIEKSLETANPLPFKILKAVDLGILRCRSSVVMATPAQPVDKGSMGLAEKHITDALKLSRLLMILADEGEADAEEDSCRALFCEIRDCAYRIQRRAKYEQEVHERTKKNQTLKNT